MKFDRETLLVASVIIAIVISVGFAAGSIIMDDAGHNEEDYNAAMAAQGADPCATPEGYTDEQWRQHMSHHKDMYPGCL